MPNNQTFDCLPLKSKDTYTMSFRIARFAITDDSYEMLVTNLDRSEFSTNDLKEIYHLRWGIETSFCTIVTVSLLRTDNNACSTANAE